MLRGKKSITQTEKKPKLKPQRARQIIRRFHVLQKNKSAILKMLSMTEENYQQKTGKLYKEAQTNFHMPKKPEVYIIDKSKSKEELITILGKIDGELNSRGGLQVYQMASVMGQANQRGGDSSKKLVEWMKELNLQFSNALEIGSLLSQNAILTCGMIKKVTRIDLKSQDPGVIQCDFMKMDIPTEKFDLILCSLVLNFVPGTKERGEMLKRIKHCLEPVNTSCLFLVLPLPCTTNSRYFNEEILNNIMNWLGFSLLRYHEANKVAYWLYSLKSINPLSGSKNPANIKKKELSSGAKNNFYIDMR